MVENFVKLKTSIQSLIEYQKNRQLNQHSYEAFVKLDEHFLNDIGLIDEDLHLLRKGKTPQRFQFTNVAQVKPAAAMRLVSSAAVSSENVDNQLFELAQLDKAA